MTSEMAIQKQKTRDLTHLRWMEAFLYAPFPLQQCTGQKYVRTLTNSYSQMFSPLQERVVMSATRKSIEVMRCTAGGARGNNHRLLEETAGIRLLDSGFHRTVSSERWLSNLTSGLCDKERPSIHIEHSSAIFRFDDGEHMKALQCVMFFNSSTKKKKR